VARYNSTNRWTDSLGIPQEEHRELLTPTSQAYLNRRSIVAPFDLSVRPPLEPRELWQQEFQRQRERSPRFSLVDEAETLAILGDTILNRTPAPHERLLANFPTAGKGCVEQLQLAQTKGNLPPLLKAQIAWLAARHDRAWYAQAMARARLHAFDVSDDMIFAMEDGQGIDDATSAALHLAEKLTVTPQAIVDADIEAVRKHYGDSQTAEIVYHITLAALVNRFTEAAGLGWTD
jgi:alkylhydroperoxidase family enzyme